jgi:hypothetical protein
MRLSFVICLIVFVAPVHAQERLPRQVAPLLSEEDSALSSAPIAKSSTRQFKAFDVKPMWGKPLLGDKSGFASRDYANGGVCHLKSPALVLPTTDAFYAADPKLPPIMSYDQKQAYWKVGLKQYLDSHNASPEPYRCHMGQR